MNRPLRFFFVSLFGGLAVMLLLAGGTVYLVDPMQHYRLARAYPARYYWPLQRHINPGLARHARYDIVVTGSSLMQNLLPGDVGNALNGRALNIAQGAMTAWEMARLLDVALDQRSVKHVLLDLNVNSFAGAPDARLTVDEHPAYLYDRNPLNDFRYLLQGRVLARAIDIILGTALYPYSPRQDGPWYWGDNFLFSSATVVSRLDPRNLNRDYQQPTRSLEAMKLSFTKNLMPIIEDHPETMFSLIHPPYSLLAWADFAQREQLEVTLAFRSWVFERTREYQNVRIYDYQADLKVIENLDNYMDIYHYSPVISRWMLSRLKDGDGAQTAQDLASNQDTLRTLARSVDPVALVARLASPKSSDSGSTTRH